MTLEQLYVENYSLHDDAILAIQIEKEEVVIAKIKISTNQTIKKRKYRECKLLITLSNVVEMYMFDEKEILGYYSDLTLVQLENKYYYISFDPYGNANERNENDNYVFIAENLEFVEL